MTIIRIISQCRRNQGFIYIIYIVYLEFSVNSLIIYNDTIDHSRANPYNIIQFTFNKLDHVFSYLVCISPYTKWSANSSKLAWKKTWHIFAQCVLVTRRVFSRVTIFCTSSPLSLSLSPTFFFLLSFRVRALRAEQNTILGTFEGCNFTTDRD